jgi:signal transduction histidine kinase
MSRSPDRFAPWVVLAVFLVLTAGATLYVSRMADLAVRSRFDNAAQATRDAIQGRVETYVNVVMAADSLFAAEQTVTQDEFRNYVHSLDVQRRYPGMQGIGLIVRFPKDRLQDVVDTMRAEGYPKFRVWPPEPPREEYTALIVLEPQDPRNLALLGYDMTTDPIRSEAMLRARDSGQPAATSRLELLRGPDGGRHIGFVLYIPIYLPASQEVPPTPGERRDMLYGWVYAPFRAQELFSGPIAAQRQVFDVVEVYDGGRLDAQHLLYREGQDGGDAHYTRRLTIQVANRHWTVVFRRAGAGAFSSMLSMATLIGGLIITLLLFTLVRLQARGRFAAEETAERLRQSEAELQRANQAKDEFLATLSHELRTPMTAIIGWARLLGEGDLDAETTATAIDAIQKSSRAQAQLIDDLLDVSRITAGKMRIEPRPIELAPVVAAAIDSIMPAAETKGVRVERSLPPQPLAVNGDAHRLQQVLWNLMSNAVKFTTRGGLVRVSLAARDGDAVIEVTDTGRGIDPAFLPHVFERFRQADSSMTRAYTGLGLGLAIVRHLVEIHGGRVAAASEGEGKGATFVVRLPLLRMSLRPAEAESASPHGDSLRNARLLIVDDEESVRNYAAAVFRISGADVRIVDSGAAALAQLDAWRPDVVITDLGMPEMDGYELLRRLRTRGLTVPVIALTAYARPEDREEAMRAGFNAYVAKPVEPEDLRKMVAEVLAR